MIQEMKMQEQLQLTFELGVESIHRTRGVVLLSGGMDSASLLWRQAIEMGDEVIGLAFDYGQKHNREIIAAEQLMQYLRVVLQAGSDKYPFLFKMNLPYGTFGTESCLLKTGPPVPSGSYEDMGWGPQSTEVPFRNATLIAIATSFAMQWKAEYVAIAAHAGDHGKWNYPDTSPPFMDAMGDAIYFGSDKRVGLVHPFLLDTKAEVVMQGANLGVPFELTWSCYRGGGNHCGTCPTCIERSAAFNDAGVPDPTVYEVNTTQED
jgi:7-cyano-7-deazaguanine synthase